MDKEITTGEEMAALFLRNQNALFALALSYTGSRLTAEEIVGDTIVAVLEAGKCFSCEAACYGYMKAIVRNQSVSRLRRRYRVEPADSEDLERYLIKHSESGRPFREAELQLLFQELLAPYPKEVRQAFIAHVLDGEPIPQLAKQIGMKHEALRKQIYRMKTRIAQAVPEKDMRALLFMILLYS